MNEQLRLLTELQKLDTAILADRMRIDAIPSQISSEEGPLKNAEASCEAARQNHAALEKKKKDRERDIEDLNEKIKKLRQRTSDIKTNKEYQAHLKEIEGAEKDIRKAEDELLSVMDSLEQTSKRVKAESDRVGEERAKIEAIRGELQKEVDRREQDLKGLKAERKKIVEKVAGDIYTLYTNLMKSHRGLAVVEAKNEICQGCNIHIPPQMFVELKKNDEIMHCPQCRRILYYAPPENDPGQEAAQRAAASKGTD